MLKTFLTDKMLETEVCVDSWQEAAYTAGALLKNRNLINDEFMESMINVVEKYGPYMILVPKVCFFHGEPGSNVKENCMSLVVFEKPVYFKEYDNQEIKCAFAFGAVTKEGHMELLQEFVKLLQDQDFIYEITNNGCKEKILEIIKKY